MEAKDRIERYWSLSPRDRAYSAFYTLKRLGRYKVGMDPRELTADEAAQIEDWSEREYVPTYWRQIVSNRSFLTQLLVDVRSAFRNYRGASVVLVFAGFAAGLLLTAIV